MSIRFRKSINLGGGLKLNLNKKSAGLSFGGKGARFSINSDGRKTTSIGIPGTGLYWTKSAEGKSDLTLWNIITLILLMPFIILYWIFQLILWPFKLLFKSLKKNKALKVFITLFLIIVIIAFVLLFIDKIKITVGNEIRYISLTSDVLWIEDNSITCYDDGLTYLKNKDITVKNVDFRKVGFLWYHRVTFEEGNLCEYEFYIDEKDFLYIITKGEVQENDDKLDLLNLIKGKEAVVGNKKYPWDEERKYISYKVDDKYLELYVSQQKELLVIQIGNSDEGPKYIAYR